jgi:hypothetical protein
MIFLQLCHVLKIIFIYAKRMEYKLFKTIKDIAMQMKIKILISKVKIALRQFLTSYFDGGTFHFKCRYKLCASIYIIYVYIIRK